MRIYMAGAMFTEADKQYNLRLADILTAFFRHSMQAYQDGKLKIRREPVATQMQVKGWSE